MAHKCSRENCDNYLPSRTGSLSKNIITFILQQLLSTFIRDRDMLFRLVLFNIIPADGTLICISTTLRCKEYLVVHFNQLEVPCPSDRTNEKDHKLCF